MKTAIIGAGRMGQRHLSVASNLGLELAGMADRLPEALALAAEHHGLDSAMLYNSVEQMLADAQPDCVVVATTAPSHASYTCMAAERGVKFILCEKPMAVSLAECDRMISTCQANGSLLAINHQMRFMEQYTVPKSLLADESFGGLASVTVVAGNFGLAMNGTHYFEMFRYLTDQAPAAVTAWLDSDSVPNPRGAQFEDRSGGIRVTNGRGQRLYMDVGADQGHGVKVIYGGRYGQIVVDELAGTMTLSCRESEHRALPTTRYGMPWHEEVRHIAPAELIAPTQEVLSALLDGKGYPSGEDGRSAVATLVAAYVSDEEGHRTVRLAEDTLPRDRVFPWA